MFLIHHIGGSLFLTAATKFVRFSFSSTEKYGPILFIWHFRREILFPNSSGVDLSLDRTQVVGRVLGV